MGKKHTNSYRDPFSRAIRDLVRQKLFQSADVFGKAYGYAVRPIFLERNGRAELFGSGVLFRAGTRSFVFTAAHVAAEAANGNLLIGSVTEVWHLPNFVSTRPDANGRDVFDVAVVELPEDLAIEFAGCRFVTPEEIDVDDRLSAGRHYSYFGFPHRAQKFDSARGHFSLTATLFTGVKLAERDYAKISVPARVQITASPEIHIAVSFDSTKVMSLTGKRAIGHQHGISGCGLWRRDDLTEGGSYNLVGIILGAQTKGTRAVCATRISVLVEMLRAIRPDLDEHLPRSTAVNLDTRAVLDPQTEE